MSLASDEETNFARVSQIIIELYPQTLRDVLLSLVDPAKLPPPVKLKGNASSKLSADQRTILHDLPNDGDYDRCDTSMLYILYRGLPGVNIKPTKGWGKLPIDQSHVALGDDVERIRVLRNRMFGHVQNAVLNNQEFLDFINEARDIMGRFDNQHGGSYPCQPGAGSYVAKVNAIENKVMDSKACNEFRNELLAFKASEAAMDVRIKDLETDKIRLEGNYDKLNKSYLSTAKSVLDIQEKQLVDEESISTLKVNQAECNDLISVIQSEQVKDKTSIIDIQRNLETINEKLDNKVATLPKNEQIGDVAKGQRSLFIDDGTNHYQCISGTSFYAWAHHSSNQDPSKLLNSFKRDKYIPEKVSYQLYEHGDTRLYSPEELESKFLEKFRTIFSANMERQPWLLTNLHEDCVENKDFYEFCKKVEKWALNDKHSFLFADYRSLENLSQISVDIEILKKDLDVGEEDSKCRILLYLAEKRMIFNIQFVQCNSECDEDMKRKKIVEAILRGQDDLKLFSALNLDLLENSDVCFTSLVAVTNLSKENLYQLKICDDCTENLILSSDDLKNDETLAKKLNKLIFQRNKKLKCTPGPVSTNELYEKLASKIWASLSVRDVHLANLSVNDQNTLTRIYLNNDQRRFLHFKYKSVILKGGYGSGKSILAQEKFKERINHAGSKDQLYYLVFSDDTLYTSVLRASIQSSLPTHVSKDQIHILNIDEYKTRYMTLRTVSLFNILNNLHTRHRSVKDCQVTVIIDELDGSFITKEEALMIGATVKNFHYALFVIQSIQVSRTVIEKIGLLNTKKTALEGHQLDYMDMKVITLHMIMRNSTRINQLSRMSVKLLERHTSRFFERDVASGISFFADVRTKPLLAPNDCNDVHSQKDNRTAIAIKERTLANTVPEISVAAERKETLSQFRFQSRFQNDNFDHCAKLLSTNSQRYTGISFESSFKFPGDWTNGHAIEGCAPKLIYPFSHDAINYTSINNEMNKLRMFFTLKHLVEVECHIGELAIIAFDAIDAQLIFEILNILEVPVIVHAPSLLMTSEQPYDTLQNSLSTHILITDHIGARGMEFKHLVVAFNPNEILLQHYLIEAFTRAIFDLSFLLIYKQVQELKEDSRWKETSVCNKLIKEWSRKNLVDEHRVTICRIHKEDDFTAGLYCTTGKVIHGIHPWHTDFDKSSGIRRIKEPYIDTEIIVGQFNRHMSPKSSIPVLGRDYFKVVKIAVYGAKGVGKTRAVKLYTKQGYDDLYVSYGKFEVARITIDGLPIKLQIQMWNVLLDHTIHPKIARTNAVTLWCDVTDKDSYQSIMTDHFLFMQKINPGAPVILVGNKIDLSEDRREFTTEQGWELAKQINAVTYIECSALTGEGVEKVFEEAARLGLEYCLQLSDRD